MICRSFIKSSLKIIFCAVCNAISKKKLSLEMMKILYYSFSHSNLEFSSIFMYFLLIKLIINKIIIQQKQAIRLPLNLPKVGHITEAFISLDILPFETLCKYNVMKFIFNTSYNTNAFSEYFKRNYQVRNMHNLRNKIPRLRNDKFGMTC